MQESLARLVDQLKTIGTEMLSFWQYMLDHDRMQRQAIHVTVRAAFEKMRGG